MQLALSTPLLLGAFDASAHMYARLQEIKPEIALAVGAVICLILGLARQASIRRLATLVAGLSLVACIVLTAQGQQGADSAVSILFWHGNLASFTKLAVSFVGLALLCVTAAVPLEQPSARAIETGKAAFEPGDVVRGEFMAFFLMSLAGAMLCAGADDLTWLFLALELASLPTYVMIAMSRPNPAAQESAVKYLFLGSLAAAIFLYGFALIYGATGLTNLADIKAFIEAQRGNLSPMLITGFLLAIVGIAFKIAAVPMHFYAADVYQGSSSAVSAFLAFVPKTAGFVSLILLLSMLGWPLPAPVAWILCIMAVLTMTVGNVLGLLQTNIKRMLGYSSVAHSGYMLLALVAGPSIISGEGRLVDGTSAVLFYLVAYGFSNLAAFAVLGSLQTRGEDSEDLSDIAGLAKRHPALAAILLLSMLSLIGLPPLVGFSGKLLIFSAALSHASTNPAFYWLVGVGLINSAIGAVYYLRVIGAAYFSEDNTQTDTRPGMFLRELGAAFAAVMAVFLGVAGSWLVDNARNSSYPAQLSAPSVSIEQATPRPIGTPATPPATDPKADPKTFNPPI